VLSHDLRVDCEHRPQAQGAPWEKENRDGSCRWLQSVYVQTSTRQNSGDRGLCVYVKIILFHPLCRRLQSLLVQPKPASSGDFNRSTQRTSLRYSPQNTLFSPHPQVCSIMNRLFVYVHD
jgi:hypothetical protein